MAMFTVPFGPELAAGDPPAAPPWLAAGVGVAPRPLQADSTSAATATTVASLTSGFIDLLTFALFLVWPSNGDGDLLLTPAALRSSYANVSTCRALEARASRAGSLGDAVEHDAQQDDGDRRGEAFAEVLELGEAGDNVIAQAAGPDETAEDDDREDHDDPLVGGEEQGGRGDGQAHLAEQLQLGCARCGACLDEGFRDGSNARLDQSDDRWHGIDHGREYGREPTRTEQRHGRQQIDERRHRLGEVENRSEEAGEPVAPRGGDPDGDPGDQGQANGDEDARQRLHAVLPDLERRDQQQAD